jgi:DNA-binding LacI/PurR family transcriptional regulator
MQPTSTTGKRVTAADVARSLGISRATVGFVLNDTPGQSISAPTRERVIAEAKRLGYRPHAAARALASGHSRIILLVLPDWPLEFSMRTHLDEASFALDRAGYSLVTMTPHAGGQARPLWETLSPDVVMAFAPLEPEVVARIRAAGVAHVLIPGEPAGELPADLGLGFADGPRLQVEHLAERGRRRLAFASIPDPRLASLAAQRSELAERTMASMPNVTWAGVRAIDEDSAAEALDAWLADGVDGIVAYNDDVAAIVVGAAVRRGVPIPDALSIIGHDDTPLARLFVPSLSTVRIDTTGLGRYFAEIALSAANGSEAPIAGPEAEARLVARETT